MYKRDLAIVLLSFFGLFLTLQDQGTFSFRKAWYHQLQKESEPFQIQRTNDLPPALVGDLNGDGQIEVVVANYDYKIQLIKPKPPGRAGEGFAPAELVAQVSLLPKKVSMGIDRRPVAMAVGYIDPEPTELVRAPRKQVLVVVTASWQVLAFDHNLSLMWEADVEDALPPHARLHEVAVYVSPRQVRVGDKGLVVVGASVELGDVAAAETGAAAGGAASLLEGVLAEEEGLAAEESQHAHQQAKPGAKVNLTEAGAKLKQGANKDGVDTSRHFSYFAFEGSRGEAVWSHTTETGRIGLDAENDADVLEPQHNFRLDAEKMNSRHFGETSCREFRTSLLHVLPHSWSAPRDTRLEDAVFVKQREGTGSQKSRLAAAATARASARGTSQVRHTSLLGKSSKQRAAAAAAAWKSSAVDAGKALDVHHLIHTHTPNALVAHLQEGMEVMHLHTGRTLCELHLPDDTLHVDLNGDGVIDHVRVASGKGRTALGAVSSTKHAYLGTCQAIATSGIPPRDHLWLANVCAHHRSLGDAVMLSEEEKQEEEDIHFLTPVFLPIPREDGTYSHLMGQHGLLLFMSSDGAVGGFNAYGHRLWQAFFDTHWNPTLSTSSEVPSLQTISLRVGAVPMGVLAVGAQAMVIISEHGHELARMPLNFPPLQPATIMDFNGDGLNDVIVVTAGGIFGYAQVQHMGGLSFGALLLTLIIAMGVVYYTQQVSSGAEASGKAARKLRSTEYVD